MSDQVESAGQPLDDVPEVDAAQLREPPATSRLLLLLVFLGVMTLVLFRAPAAYSLLEQNLPPDMAEGIGDPSLERLALNTGLVLAVLTMAFSLAIFLFIATMLEKHLFKASLPLGKLRLGLFTATVAASFVYTQVHALISPPTSIEAVSLWNSVIVLAIGLCVPLLYRKHLRGRTIGQKVLVFGLSGLLALLTTIGL